MLRLKVETNQNQPNPSLLEDEFKASLRSSYNAKLERKLRCIKQGEFRRLFKGNEFTKMTSLSNSIPAEQISIFENRKQDSWFSPYKTDVDKGKSFRKSEDKKPKLSGIDEILYNREKLRPNSWTDEVKKTAREKVRKPILDQIEAENRKAWADRCFEVVYNELPSDERENAVETLLKWDDEPLSIANVLRKRETIKPESLEMFDRDPSTEEGETTSELSEKILRKKTDIPGQIPTSTVRSHGEVKKVPKLPVNIDLAEFFIKDLTELESLTFNEELYAFHPTKGITGSWRVDMKVCETDHKLVNVQFEGLIEDDETHHAMFATGIVSSDFTPITEFRVEQVSSPKGSTSNSIFFHKKGSRWLFDLREGLNDSETRKFTSLKYPQMMRVISESAQILLLRKIVMYYYPLNVEESTAELHENPCELCPCMDFDKICTCDKGATPYVYKKAFKLKMRSFSIGGDVCGTNYRFFAPVKIKFNDVELSVIRVRRRMDTPGNLIQTTNYYFTTAGQLMAITFNDPYPFDTSFWLQVDKKAVLNPHGVVPPERIVPLRERYMCDPQLKQFYEDEVERLTQVNRTYAGNLLHFRTLMNSLLRDILNDKPHRVVSFVQDFFTEGYGVRRTK